MSSFLYVLESERSKTTIKSLEAFVKRIGTNAVKSYMGEIILKDHIELQITTSAILNTEIYWDDVPDHHVQLFRSVVDNNEWMIIVALSV